MAMHSLFRGLIGAFLPGQAESASLGVLEAGPSTSPGKSKGHLGMQARLPSAFSGYGLCQIGCVRRDRGQSFPLGSQRGATGSWPAILDPPSTQTFPGYSCSSALSWEGSFWSCVPTWIGLCCAPCTFSSRLTEL